MGHEINADSILALDKRIKETTTELTRLKRSRNSLLNVARIPPEILGRIFHFNDMPKAGKYYIPELRRDPYNILLVCYHWSRVARDTPELWSFWGNTLEDWRRRYPLSRASAPVDLVLSGPPRKDGPLDEILRDVLRDRAARDAIRKVHIASSCADHSTATAVVSSLTPEDEGIRHSSIESIMLSRVDVSDFVARHHFQKLRDLYLNDFKISCWDHLKSHTMALVNLTITFGNTSPPSVIPTTSQVLSLLASNPNIRSLALEWLAIRDDGRNDSTRPVSLPHLEQLALMGDFNHVFPILYRLELPERMDDVVLDFYHCKLAEAQETIRPYIRDYLQRDPRFKNRLGVFSSSDRYRSSLQVFTLGVGHHDPGEMPPQELPRVKFGVGMSKGLSLEEQGGWFIDTLALVPQERVVCLKVNRMVAGTERVFAEMPNIEYLHLANITLREGFLLSCSGSDQTLLPSLRRLCLKDVWANYQNWDPLIAYLTHQTSGNRVLSLEVFGGGVHICSDVLDQIYELVEEMVYEPNPYKECLSKRCIT